MKTIERAVRFEEVDAAGLLFFPVFGLNLLRSGDKSGSGKGKKSKPRRTAAARKASA